MSDPHEVDGQVSGRIVAVATGYGLVAGAVACGTFFLMRQVQHLVWGERTQWWYVFLVVCVGGALIAATRRAGLEADVDDQLDPQAARSAQWRRIGVLGLSAVVAVGFGGAVGPEAGLIAVVTELSLLVRDRIARTRAEADLITEAGGAAALAGLYASPPAGAAYRDGAVGRLPVLAASLSGFVGFVVTWHLLGLETHALEVPEGPAGGGLPSAWVVAAAVLGAAAGCGYLLVRHSLLRLAARLGPPARQTMIGSVALAALLAAFPVLRFSGHDDFPVLTAWVVAGSWGLLLAVGAAKVVATALTLASGWRGGDVFPLMFAGAAVGSAVAVLQPGLDAQTAMVAGMSAAAVVGLRKPLAVLVIVWFLVPGADAVALTVACGLGVLVLRVVGSHPAFAARGH